jgi:hypothetical protein
VTNLPCALPGTQARILATTDLGADAVPLLCANADVGLPPSTLLETAVAPSGSSA